MSAQRGFTVLCGVLGDCYRNLDWWRPQLFGGFTFSSGGKQSWCVWGQMCSSLWYKSLRLMLHVMLHIIQVCVTCWQITCVAARRCRPPNPGISLILARGKLIKHSTLIMSQLMICHQTSYRKTMFCGSALLPLTSWESAGASFIDLFYCPKTKHHSDYELRIVWPPQWT